MDRITKLALFDCDGTLVDSQNAIVAAMADAWSREGLGEPDPQRVRRIVGLSLNEAMARLRPNDDPALHETLADHYKRAFQRQRQAGQFQEPLYPGLREVLETLERAGVLMGVATGKSMRGLQAVLELHDLSRFFVTLQTADVGPGKPHPEMVYRALAESGVAAADTVMIGDTVFDIEMGVRAGAATIGVTWGYHPPEELRAAGALRVVDTASELASAVLELLA